MSFIFQRSYGLEAAPPATTTTTLSAPAPSPADITVSTTHTQASGVATSSAAAEEHTTTHVCHSWSYYDPSRDETVIVVLHAHHSLHVDVGGESAGASPHGTHATTTTTTTAASAAWTSSDTSYEGLCGYTWELTWLPRPPTSSVTAETQPPSVITTTAAAPATRARFFFRRRRPLALSTLHGCGGVVFCSSRHVLIATEAAAPPAPSTAAVAPSLHLDSFVVVQQQQQQQRQQPLAQDAPAGPVALWQRVVSAVRLPCGALHTSVSRVTPLLVTAEAVSRGGSSNGSEEAADVLRVLYVATVTEEGAAQLQAPVPSSPAAATAAEHIFVGVADVLDVSATSALTCVPRHATSEPAMPLRLTRAKRVTTTAAPPLDLHLRDLLWLYVADPNRNRLGAVQRTILYGTLVALVPGFEEISAPAAGGGSGGVGGAATAAAFPHLQLPDVVYSGFRSDTRYGVVGVAGDALEALALQEAQQRQRSGAASAGRAAAAAAVDAEDLLAQLLPATERSVYELQLGRPSQHLLSAVAVGEAEHPRLLPPHTSVLMYVCDGLSTRVPASSSSQGLYTTQTSTWWEMVAAVAAAGGPAHRLPLSRTLWCDLAPLVPSRAAELLPRAAASAEERDMFTCSLSEWAWWSAQVTGGAAEGRSSGEGRGEDVDASPPAANTRPAICATTSTPFFSSAQDTVAWCLPVTNVLTQEMTVWYVVHEATQKSLPPSSGAGAVAARPPQLDVEERNVDEMEWEARVVEWVLHIHLLPQTSSAVETAAITTNTYAVLKLLWAYAVHHTSTPATTEDAAAAGKATATPMAAAAATAAAAPPPPAWLEVLMDVLRSTADEAAKLQMRLYLYATAIPSLVSAGLLSGRAVTPAVMEAEVAHLRRTAVLFLRLVLRVLVELDWHAGDAQGRRCCESMARWFLGAAAAAANGDLRDDAVAWQDGRAVQVLLQLGAAEPVLAWLRRMLLLYTCRCRTRPLELTLSDVVEAAGVLSDASQQQRSADEVAEWRASMEYALLRMVRPDTLHSTLESLACTGGRQLLRWTASPQRTGPVVVGVRGLLSLADLHALVCVGWGPAQVQEAAPLGFSFVCALVDVAMRAAESESDASPTAERYERLVLACLENWELGDGEASATDRLSHEERVPVYPLLSLLGPTSGRQDVAGGAAPPTSPPFPFSLLPPLLTIYVWHHTVDRLCTALQLLPGLSTTTTGTRTIYGDDADSTSWWRRGQIDRATLCGLHRATCALRSLTQDSLVAAAELFAAIRLAAIADAGASARITDTDNGGVGDDGGVTMSAAELAGAAALSWGTRHLLAWQQLLPLAAPPLSTPGAVEAYTEHCHSTRPLCALLLRVLHYVYASAGGGHLLRGQLWRVACGRRGEADSGEAGGAADHSRSVEHLETSLQAWMADACTAATATATATHAPSTTSPPSPPVSSDTVAPWLQQVWTHVLLCDPTAVTDVAVYEQMYAALAYVRQRVDNTHRSSSSSSTSAPLSPAGADAGFALLRPCLMYAYPLLRQLAVAEETVRDGPLAASLPHFPQFNEPLTWHGGDAGVCRARPSPPPPEHLCAGEVCERVRRQISRLIALYEAPAAATATSTGGGRGDVRFRVLGLLLSLMPPAADVAQRQRRLARCTATSGSARSTPAAPAALADAQGERSSSSSSRSKSSDGASHDGHPSEGSEEAMEMAHFSLSPTATYAVAAAAPVISGSAGAPHHLGWFTVVCEVLRRELRASLMAELVLTGCVQNTLTEEAGDRADQWTLVATEPELKRFFNALADAVEPLTDALVTGLSAPLFRSLLILLVFDILHALLLSNTQTPHSGGSPAAPVQPSIHASAQLLQLVGQWIKKIVAPRHRSLSSADKTTVSHVVTTAFAEAFFDPTAAEEERRGEAPPTCARYVDAPLHQTWRQWRRQGCAATATDTAVLRCLEGCLAAEHQHLLHVDPPFGAPPPTVQQQQQHHHQQHQPLPSSGAGAVSWREAGSALRSSLIQSIGATVAPRNNNNNNGGSAAHSAHEQKNAGGSRSITPSPQPPTETREEPEAAPKPSPAPQSSVTGQESKAAVAAAAGDGGGGVLRPASRDAEEAAQLLVKEETFRRRQLTTQLLAAQQHDVFDSVGFQHSLISLYIAMRAEKRRKELVAFALDQHDLIFAFASREHQLVLEASRRGLREAWIDFGERQRLALRRVLQEERDARMGVQAVAYAERAALREMAQAEHKVWLLQGEGRSGLQLLEQDAWDVLAVAAAEARVELARRAVEAEEAAYWKAEDEAWAQMEAADVDGDGNAAAPSATARAGSQSPLVQHTRPTVALSTATPQLAPPNAAVKKTPQDRAVLLPPAEAEAASGGLFGTLARWQTALRDTVAPAPPSKAHITTTTTNLASASDAPPVAPPQPSAKPKKVEENDDWGWDSEEESEGDTQRPVDAKPTATAAAAAAATNPLNTTSTTTQNPPAAVTAPVIPLASRRTLPIARDPNPHYPPSQGHPHDHAELLAVVPLAAATKPARAKKGLAAAVLMEPIRSITSTTTATTTATTKTTAASLPPPPPPPSLPPLPPAPVMSHAEALPPPSARAAANADEATPNPVRSILSAVEAAATETISKVRAVPPSPSPSPASTSPTATPTRRSTTQEERNVAEVVAAPQQQSSTGAQRGTTETAVVAAVDVDVGGGDDDGWGWSEEEEGGDEALGKEGGKTQRLQQTVAAEVPESQPVRSAMHEPRATDVELPSHVQDDAPVAATTAVETAPVAKVDGEASEDGWGWEEEDEEEEGEMDARRLSAPPPVHHATPAEEEPQVSDSGHAPEDAAAVAPLPPPPSLSPSRPPQQQQQQQPSAAEALREDDGWGWSEEEGEDAEGEAAATAAALPTLPTPPFNVVHPPLEQPSPAAHGAPHPSAAADAGDPFTGGIAEEKTREGATGRGGWSDDDGTNSFGSDVVMQPPTAVVAAGAGAAPRQEASPLTTTAAVTTATADLVAFPQPAEPQKVFAGSSSSNRTDLQLQQIYQSELEIRDEMVNYL